MAPELFVDTGAWVALADEGDGHHGAAAAVYPRFLASYARLVTTSLVVAETYTLLRAKLGHRAAVRFLDAVNASPRIERVLATKEIESAAEDILRQYEDQPFSYADAVSFAVMRHRRIREAFAFDRHFAAAGFVRVPADRLL